MGATAYGNGSPALPGIYANFSLADAIFQPLAAQQLVGARRQAALFAAVAAARVGVPFFTGRGVKRSSYNNAGDRDLRSKTGSGDNKTGTGRSNHQFGHWR
jgi:hypothetical protein